MSKIKHVAISALLCTSLAACTEAPLSSDEIGQNLQDLCANGDGVNSAMAALAVAAAKELGRWQSASDFAIVGNQIALTSTGRSQCGDGHCWNTQAILDLQRAPLGSVKFGSVSFNADNFKSRLVAEYRDQQACDSRPGFQPGNCFAEPHRLTFRSQQPGACDTIFTFDATSPTGAPLWAPAQLKNKLIFVGYPENPYLAFSSTGSTVSLDPTVGLTEGNDTAAGTCKAACIKASSSDLTGQCCNCASAVRRKFVKATFSSNLYLCK